jgi:hypothetical protein
VLGTGAAGLALMADRSEAGEGDDEHGHSEHSALLKECAEACGHCEAACNEAFHHCISAAGSGKAEHVKMAQMVIDCAAFCTLAAAMIARHSPLMVASCRACAEACEKCAEDCSPHAVHEVMKHCVDSCKKCAEICRKMIKDMGGEHHH